MTKKFEIRNSTAEFLTFVAENKEDGVQVFYKDETIWAPMGSIDGSVLTAVGLLLLFSFVEKLPEAIAAGRSVKIQKGDTSLEVSGKDSV